MSTISKENYLKTIYLLNNDEAGSATTSVIAKSLEITNAATSEMAKKLADNGLINYEKYQSIELTEKGEHLALKIIRRHRLWELFLIKVLNLSWGEVHEQAELLEHSSSDFLIEKIDEYLGNPKFDPHGDPIPDKKGNFPEYVNGINLKNAQEGNLYKVIRVDDKKAGFIDYLSKIGIYLFCEIKIQEKLSFDNSVMIEINGKSHLISEKASEKIFVNILE